ncbi:MULTISPECIES: polysaccharide deacetylase family protein [unclassified Fusibacter]|uniref:polysaccharide deacetylase family protein n=1 Tax=unclassified Fusibacter TaxID=2624464 RepID=UPI0010123A93|nr:MULTISPECIES: polysaccharide deacetylase family protein [unclassified Fusibacter]MCK8058322.1 polysaccharide deacetylase family protein [Fusibacter sp. A2]NPE20905.1 polysaccharide deacetylase family protein [Fusibacter sp. A1]RXV63109.1 xylanase [Fusibacter sp. A1]
MMYFMKWAVVLQLTVSLLSGPLSGDVVVKNQGINEEDAKAVAESIDYEKIVDEHKPNELGQVMIVMYHNLVSDPSKEGYYARTPENFKKDLIRLYSEGYVPITMTELVTGDFDVPAGKTPIVLTFDDGHPSNFQYLEDGTIDPSCVIGIFESMEREYEGFGGKAIFYVNQPVVFGNAPIDANKVEYLLTSGYELGNHTAGHVNLTEVDQEKQRSTIVKQAEYLEALNGNSSFHFSVPFGQKPKDYFELVKGEGWLAPYRMVSSVNVGWNPIKSPFDTRFDAYDLNRITVGDDDYELNFWLDYFKDNPGRRFISDGLKDVITINKETMEYLSEGASAQKRVLLYDEGGIEWKTK